MLVLRILALAGLISALPATGLAGEKVELTDQGLDEVTAAGIPGLINVSFTLFYKPPFFHPDNQVTTGNSNPSVTGNVLPLFAVKTTQVGGTQFTNGLGQRVPLIQTSQQLTPYFVKPGVVGFKFP